ncbi:MAG TPA: hypothetical protein VF179_19465 [Thermoanaerobaculia bacterium]|nr:hypothetical protein [Thermoanaerobaculia bacterium]
MSLIDEALRRARQEATRQDAAKREEAYRHVPVLPPMASRRSSPLRPALLGAAVALLVVGLVALGIYIGGGGRGGSPEPEPRVAGAPSAAPVPVPEPPQRPVAVVEETPEPEPTPAPEPEPKPTPAPVVVVPIPAPPAPEPEPLPTPIPTPAPTPEPTPTPVPEVRTYVREIPLPEGGSLRLNGIAFSAAQPVALINDKVLAKGESYQGFMVTDIQANLVELRKNGTIVRVTLK